MAAVEITHQWADGSAVHVRAEAWEWDETSAKDTAVAAFQEMWALCIDRAEEPGE